MRSYAVVRELDQEVLYVGTNSVKADRVNMLNLPHTCIADGPTGFEAIRNARALCRTPRFLKHKPRDD